MSVRLRLVAVVLALLVPGLALVAWSFVDGPSMQIPPTAVPSRLGSWSGGADEQLDHEIREILGPSSYVARTYEARGRHPIALYVGFYEGRVGRLAAHDPAVCYPGAGWETATAQAVDVPVAEGTTLRAQLLEAHRGSARQLVLYWFQPAARWPQGIVAEELMFVLDAVAGRPQYAFVRLVASVPEAASHAAVLRDLIAFASEVAWPVRALVSGEHPRSLAPYGSRPAETPNGAYAARWPQRNPDRRPATHRQTSGQAAAPEAKNLRRLRYAGRPSGSESLGRRTSDAAAQALDHAGADPRSLELEPRGADRDAAARRG